MARIIPRMLVFLLPLAIFGLFSGCAPLPKTSEIIGSVPAGHGPPRIDSARGLLSPSQSKAILERLKRTVEPTDILHRHLAVMETVSGNPLVKGNRVELLVDGPATYAAMFRAIENAKDHVNMETFIFEDDETGRRLADLLMRKQQEGVQANLIYDTWGVSIPRRPFSRHCVTRGSRCWSTTRSIRSRHAANGASTVAITARSWSWTAASPLPAGST